MVPESKSDMTPEQKRIYRWYKKYIKTAAVVGSQEDLDRATKQAPAVRVNKDTIDKTTRELKEGGFIESDTYFDWHNSETERL